MPSAARWVQSVAALGRFVIHEFAHAEEETEIQVELALSEAVGNAVKHAHRYDAALPVRVQFRWDGQCFEVDVYDQGPGFDLSQVRPLGPEDLSDHGRGVTIMQAVMDEVTYRPAGSGNCLHLSKRLAPRPSTPAPLGES